MSDEAHKKNAPVSVGCAVITVSDTREEDTDCSGRMLRQLLSEAGHTVCSYSIVKDEPDQIREQLAQLGRNPACQAILINGGTGISPRDRTCEAVWALLDKRLDGFGELFRVLSFNEMGSAAMLSRALAGTIGRQVVFCMPGSPHAVRLATTRLILPELGHLLGELTKPA